jgi:hypothetical protein
MSYIDSRLINLNSDDAIRLNGTKLSNVEFNFSNVLKEEKDIIFSSGGVSNASFAFSFYNINERNNGLAWNIEPENLYNITGAFSINVGMYNMTSFLKELQTQFNISLVGESVLDQFGNQITVACSFNSTTGKIRFLFNSNLLVGFYNNQPYLTNSMMFVLGFNIAYGDTGYDIQDFSPPYPANLLGIKKINIYSSALANTSLDSKTKANNDLVRSINVDVAPYGLISFANTTGIYGRFKNKRINNIDIRLLDENENYIDFNNIGWAMSIQIIMTKKLLIQDNYFDINSLANLNLPKENPQTINKNEKQDSLELLNEIKNDLDLLTYN